MVSKDDFDIFCEDNGIMTSSTLDGNKHSFEIMFLNGEILSYRIDKISQIDELYRFRKFLYGEAQLKMRQIKLDKLNKIIDGI